MSKRSTLRVVSLLQVCRSFFPDFFRGHFIVAHHAFSFLLSTHDTPARYAKWYRSVECKLFLAGNCKHGDTCLFKHSTPTTSPTPNRDIPSRSATATPTLGDNLLVNIGRASPAPMMRQTLNYEPQRSSLSSSPLKSDLHRGTYPSASICRI